MAKSFILLPFAALALAASPALAANHVRQPEASIPFVDHGGIWNWASEGDDTLFFQDTHKQWYKATLFAPSPDLPFAFGLRIDAGPMDTLDKWSAVYIDGQRYPFLSFEKVAAPPSNRPVKKL